MITRVSLHTSHGDPGSHFSVGGPLIGSRLGNYEITASLGEGGMGAVYRARDPELERDVAIKVLPQIFTEDPDRVARFEREAKVLASLNHPNIGQLYGLASEGATKALVMELVEGPTLAERLEQGAFPLEEALAVACQIAEALEAAHEKGIVHRDLKPQNVKVTVDGKVKLLDFGLAKALDPAGGSAAGPTSASQLAASPTVTRGATVQGMILGTAAYMAPEQAKGLAVDKRADIWAFGVVLWEMLSGRRLFQGDTVPEILAAVIRDEVDLGALPATTPPAVRQLVGRCLERDAKRRLRDIGEARVLLEGPLPAVRAPVSAGATEAKRLLRIAVAAGLVAIVAIAVAGWLVAGSDGRAARVVRRDVMRLHLLPPDGGEFDATNGPVVLSPDGSSIAFRVDAPEGKYLAVRRLDSFATVRLPGTDGAYEPFWSPDGRNIGFFGDQLSMVDAAGIQPPRPLAAFTDPRGASWGPQGILYAPAPGSAIFLVDPGGEPRQITTVDQARGEGGHLRPQHLPGGEHFLYLVRSQRPEVAGLYVGSFDGGPPKRILPIQVAAHFAEPDLLLIVQEQRLVVRRLDLATLEVGPEAWVLADGVDYVTQFSLAPVSTSGNGRLVYHPSGRPGVQQLRRVDRAGVVLESIGEPGDRNLDLSPDGTRLATERTDGLRRSTIWIRDLQRGVVSRLATDGPAIGPVWSPDGRYIAYAQTLETLPRVVVRPAAGGPPRVILQEAYIGEPIDWSPDGKTLLVESGNPGERSNLVLVPADGSGPVTPFVKGPANETYGRFSPDGRHIAYRSEEAGRGQIYVEPTERTGARWLVSPGAGDSPRWSREGNGLFLFYVEQGERDGVATLMRVEVARQGDELTFGSARKLGPIPSGDYELEPGSGQILVSVPIEEGEPAEPVLVDGWPALLDPR